MITPESLARSGTEDGEQMALFCWASQNLQRYPSLRWMFAIPNGGARSAATAGRLKATGVKSGVADIFLPYTLHGSYGMEDAGLWIEMKRANGVPSDVKDEQIAFARHVLAMDYRWEVCFGWAQAVKAIETYISQVDYEQYRSLHQQTVMKKVYEKFP